MCFAAFVIGSCCARPALAQPNNKAQLRTPPTQSELERLSELIRELYGNSTAAIEVNQLRAKADKLLLDYPSEKNVDVKYAMLHEAFVTSIHAGDLKFSLDVAKRMNATYSIDLDAMVESGIENALANTRSPSQANANLSTLQYIYRRSITSGNLDSAERLIKLITKNSGGNTKRFTAAKKEISRLKKMKSLADQSVGAVKAGNASSKDNEAVGQWLCFGIGDFKNGIPLLANGTERNTRELARDEMSIRKSQPKKLYVIANRWNAHIGNRQTLEANAIRDHVRQLYTDCLKTLDGLEMRRVEQQFDQFMMTHPVFGKMSAATRAALRKHGGIIGQYYDIQWVDNSNNGAFEQFVLQADGKCMFYVGRKFYSTTWTALPNAIKVRWSDKNINCQAATDSNMIVKKINTKTKETVSRTVSPLGR